MIFTLFHLRRYKEALKLANRIIEIRGGETDWDFLFSGIAHWLLNQKTEAIEQWGNTEEAAYKDAAGGVEAACPYSGGNSGDMRNSRLFQ